MLENNYRSTHEKAASYACLKLAHEAITTKVTSSDAGDGGEEEGRERRAGAGPGTRATAAAAARFWQIGRASCRERVYVLV